MTPVIASLIPLIIQIAVLVVLLVLSVLLINKDRESLPMVFLSFGIALWLLSDIYWLIYGLIRPDIRMPFAANEIGEAAVFLMWAATLNSAISHGSRYAIKQAAGAIIFAVCNIGLWIMWSGEWLQDIFTGLAFGWLLYSIAITLKVVRALSKIEWFILAVFCSLLIAGQGLTFLVDIQTKQALDIGCYIILSAVILYWLFKLIVSYKKNGTNERILTLAVTMVSWCSLSMYMSDEIIYSIFEMAGTLGIALVYLATRKVVKAA